MCLVLERRIDRLGGGVSFGANPDWYVRFGLSNLKTWIDWDVDGDTRFGGVPAYLFGDTYGEDVWGSLRLRAGDRGAGLGGTFRLDDLPFKVYPANTFQIPPEPPFIRNGDVCVKGGGAKFLALDRWWVVPPQTMRRPAPTHQPYAPSPIQLDGSSRNL